MTGRAQRLAILLVDDNEPTRRAFHCHLKRHDVTQANSYAAAVRPLAQLHHLDLVITDYNLGDGHTGIEVLTEVKRLFPEILRVLASSYVNAIPMAKARTVAHQIESKIDIGFIRMLAKL